MFKCPNIEPVRVVGFEREPVFCHIAYDSSLLQIFDHFNYLGFVSDCNTTGFSIHVFSTLLQSQRVGSIEHLK